MVHLFIDERASPEQRRELEAIFLGQKGGRLVTLGPLVYTLLPIKTLPIALPGEDTITVQVGDAVLCSAPRSHPSEQTTRGVVAQAMGPFDVAEG